MPAPPLKPAAYTRTGILRQFLSLVSDSLPNKVDSRFAQERMQLKGGDVRAFLQSVRVLGLIDGNGALTDRARRTRAHSQRSEAMREALEGAYPELLERWQASGGMARTAAEDFFKLDYGLSTSTAGPAAKLFCDLMREYAEPHAAPPTEHSIPTGDIPSSTPERTRAGVAAPTASTRSQAASSDDVRVAALDTVRSAVQIITPEWDQERIELLFNRVERLVDRVLSDR